MSNRRSRNAAEVQTVTSVAVPLGDDIDRRARRYLAQMALRTFCFLAAVASWGRVPTWVSVSLLVGAVVLPYIAVVLANAGRERPERPEEVLLQRRLGAVAAAGGVPWADTTGVPTAGRVRTVAPRGLPDDGPRP